MKAVIQWVLRTMMKDQTGIVRTMPKKDIIDFNVAMTAERLMRNGVDPNSLKNANQVENALDMIENKPRKQKTIGEARGIKSTKSAKVFDLEGKEIDPKKGIMGGKQIPDDDLPPPGSRGGPDDIAAPIQSEDEILEKLNRENKEATRNLQIKLSKDKGYQKFKGETEEEIRKRFGLDDPEDMAQGGRAGFSKGKLVDLARRKFLKAAAGVGAGIGALKTGLLGLGKEAAPMVEAAKETVTKAPDYFFALVDKIKRFGKSVDDPVADPRVERTYRYKNYELRENAFGDPGETIVTKTDDMGEFGYKEESMRFKKGGQTEDGFLPDEYEEITVRPDAEGKLKDVEDGIEDVSEIIEEATKSSPPIKKAGGGIARMLGE